MNCRNIFTWNKSKTNILGQLYYITELDASLAEYQWARNISSLVTLKTRKCLSRNHERIIANRVLHRDVYERNISIVKIDRIFYSLVKCGPTRSFNYEFVNTWPWSVARWRIRKKWLKDRLKSTQRQTFLGSPASSENNKRKYMKARPLINCKCQFKK